VKVAEPNIDDPSNQLRSRIEAQQAGVGIIGMGYVGLPLALAFLERGFSVTGFDVDENKTEKLNRGTSYIDYIDSGRISHFRDQGKLEATSDFGRLSEPDVLIICVPTPLTSNREPDMSYVEQTAEAIGTALRPGQLVVLESTTYPGTTEELLKPALQAKGLICGKDFFLAYSPEREDPGNPKFGPSTIPKVVGGPDSMSTSLAASLYRQVVVEVVEVSTAGTAEATKLMENIFRAVNIALVNELKLVYDEMGIDIWEVLDAAATKPFGFMRFNPGPGWGGHCIPIDPFYLAWRARQYGISTRFIELAGEVNVEMPRIVTQKMQDGLNREGKPVRGSKILIVGLAYKKDVADPRESPAFEILALLQGLGAEISYHDPHIPAAPRMRSWKDLEALDSVDLTPEMLQNQDAVIVVTDHTDVDYELILEHAQLIVDTRGIYRQSHPKVIHA
jgi:UDP-N-acetyl-D-glucosamine dehydrogenase